MRQQSYIFVTHIGQLLPNLFRLCVVGVELLPLSVGASAASRSLFGLLTRIYLEMNTVIKMKAHQEQQTLASPCPHIKSIHLKYSFLQKGVLIETKLVTFLSALCILLCL